MCNKNLPPLGVQSSQDLATGVIHFDTGEVSERYASNTIGALNGLGNQTAPLPDSLDELIHQLKLMASREA